MQNIGAHWTVAGFPSVDGLCAAQPAIRDVQLAMTTSRRDSVMRPVRFPSVEQFDFHRAAINERLILSGLIVREDGRIARVSAATTLSEAKQRASALREELGRRHVHDDVRNPAAHAPRILWAVEQAEALDMLTLVSTAPVSLRWRRLGALTRLRDVAVRVSPRTRRSRT